MRILITGASGFIGRQLTATFVTAGHEVVACLHHKQPSDRLFSQPGITTLYKDFRQHQRNEDWVNDLQGIDVVINTVGIFSETRKQLFQDLHVKGPCALFNACEQVGVKQIIQISALASSDKDKPSDYHRTKYMADQHLMNLKLNWAIVRPSLVYGPGAKSMMFFKALAALPVIPLMGQGGQLIQPVHISDVCQAILQLAVSPQTDRVCLNIVGPEAITAKSLYQHLRLWLGLGRGRYIHLPFRLFLLAGYAGNLLHHPFINSASIRMLRAGNTANVEGFVHRLGFTPLSLAEGLALTPAQPADRWHARLYLLRPLLRMSIALLWIYTGLVSAFIFPPEQSYAMLQKTGINTEYAPYFLYTAAFVDFMLGIAVMLAFRVRLIAVLQITIILIYTGIISFALPEYWIHPFGPVSKNIPLLVAIQIMMILEED